MAVPYTFGNATTSIPLSQLDTNFATAITIGNTAVQLGNTITTMNNLTLANVTISSGNATVTTLTAPTHNSASSLTFQTNGTTTAMTIDTSQNVGIGTTSPSVKFTVNGGAAVQGGGFPTAGAGIELSYNSGTGLASLQSYDRTGSAWKDLEVNALTQRFGTSGSERMRIDSSGNVGIGTSSVGNLLHVYRNNTNQAAQVQIEQAGSGSPTLGFLRTASYAWLLGQYSSDASFRIAGSGADLNTNPRLVIDTSGNVGIGTTSPGYRLEVKGASGAQGYLSIHDGTGDTTVSGNNAASLLFQARDTSIRTIAEIDAVNTTTNGTGGAMVFQTRISDTLAERMRIDSSGNLLVGATSAVASSRLLIKGSGTTSGSTNIYIQDSAATTLFYIRDDGALNTGTSSLSPYNLTTATAANAQLGADGFMRRSTSSLKYKTDVKDATHGLAEVMQLRPVTYKGKNDGNTVFGGLIAEEVDAVGLTEFVQYAEDGSPDALAYGNMVSLLVKAIQELKAELDALKGTK